MSTRPELSSPEFMEKVGEGSRDGMGDPRSSLAGQLSQGDEL